MQTDIYIDALEVQNILAISSLQTMFVISKNFLKSNFVFNLFYIFHNELQIIIKFLNQILLFEVMI